MTKEEVCQLFMAGIDCSQVVTGACAEKMGMTKEQARKMSACFGGGMMCGGDLRRCDRRVNGPWNGIWTQRGK